MKKDDSFAKAYDVMAKTLREDASLYYAYQSNIAMAFQNEMSRAGYRLPNLHEIANEAAKNFLTNFIRLSIEAASKREEMKP